MVLGDRFRTSKLTLVKSGLRVESIQISVFDLDEFGKIMGIGRNYFFGGLQNDFGVDKVFDRGSVFHGSLSF